MSYGPNWVLGLTLKAGDRYLDSYKRECVVAGFGRGDNGTPVAVAVCGDVVWPFESVKIVSRVSKAKGTP